MGPLRIRHWCQSRSKVRFALHSDASTEAATAVAAEYFPVTVKITTDWLARWSWHYKNSDAVNACRFTPPSKISVLFNLANSRQWKDQVSLEKETWLKGEPSFENLIADPIVQLVMRRMGCDLQSQKCVANPRRGVRRATTARSSKMRTRNTQQHEQPSDKPNNRLPHQNQERVTPINPPHGLGIAPAV